MAMTSMSQPLHAPELKWSTQGDLTRAHVAILVVNLCLLRAGLDPTPALRVGTELAKITFFPCAINDANAINITAESKITK